MVKEYNEVLKIVEQKLLKIGFTIEINDEFIATFGNDTNWKIDLVGERYVRPSYDIFIRKLDSLDVDVVKVGFCVRFLFDVFNLPSNLPLKDDLELLIKYKEKIFDETFPYKKKYDELNNIPDWLLLDEQK